jgi:hypothetical protein
MLWFLGCGGDPAYTLAPAAPGVNNASGTDETEIGPAVLLTPGVTLADGTSGVHALLGYGRFGFDGGRDDLIQLGVQYRHGVALSRFSRYRPWLGVEGTFVHVTSVPGMEGAYGPDNPSAKGFSFGGVASYPISQKIPVSVIGRAGVIKIGDFTAGDVTWALGQTSPYVRVGLDFDFQSFILERVK